MQNDAELDWVTRFDEPMARRPRSRALTVALGALFGGGGLAAIALLVTALTRPAEEELGQGATRTPTVAPTPSAVQTAPEQEASILPAGCGALYSESMTVTLEQIGFDLESGYDGEWHSGSADAELRALLADAELDCHWTQEQAGLLTRVAEVDDRERALAIDRLESLGFTQLSEHGGVRYFVERSAATGPTGESHFFREGLWFATHWLGHGQYGYTADMVRSVFD
jgi:hypothetical protein